MILEISLGIHIERLINWYAQQWSVNDFLNTWAYWCNSQYYSSLSLLPIFEVIDDVFLFSRFLIKKW